MGFNSVYQNLLELFPQVDTRLLKAVAIEHAKDPDKAAESILTEVLPFTIEKFNVITPIVGNNGKNAETSSPGSSIRCEEIIADRNQAEKPGIPSGSLMLNLARMIAVMQIGDHEDKRTDLHAVYHETDISLSNQCNMNEDCIKDSPSFVDSGEQQSLDCNLFGYRISAEQASVSPQFQKLRVTLFF
ncbi:Mesocentin [Bienertia sinuspersici]